MTRQFVTHPIFLPTSFPDVVTTRQLVLNLIFVPICAPTPVPILVTIRHLVLDPIAVPNSVFFFS